MRNAESDLQRQMVRLMQWLHVELPWSHIANERASQAERRVQAGLGVRPGMPDLVIPMRGARTAWVEVKADKGRLSREQANVIERLGELGHEVRVVRSLEEFERALRELGVIERGIVRG